MTRQYLDALRHIQENGTYHEDRTGTGTTRVFGYQMRFNLQDGFPILTTKKLSLRWIAEELFWFLSGSTNERELSEKGVDIWREWSTEEQCARFGRAEGDLGPVYGWAWRRFGAPYPVSAQQPPPELCLTLDRTYLGVGNGTGKHGHPLGKRWEGMMARCYDENAINHHQYGANGVHVCDRWLEFAAFAEDAPKLPGWDNLMSNVELDKDARGSGYRYGPEDCRWLTRAENSALRDRRVFVLEKDGREYRVSNVAAFCKEHGIDGRNMSDLWTGRKNAKVRHGFALVRVEDPSHGVDQIETILDQIINNPESRRIILTAWNPNEAVKVAVPPCHAFAQFVVRDGHLSCQLYQRSADAFLGVPYNIASYALLTHMLAEVAHLEVGDFVHTFGDLHIYTNHEEQVIEQLKRRPVPLPALHITPYLPNRKYVTPLEELLNIKYEHLKLIGYNPQKKIRGEVSV